MTVSMRTGIILIIAGIFIPSVLYPLATPNRVALRNQLIIASKGGSYEPRSSDLEIVIAKGNWIVEDLNYKDTKGHFENRIAVPYQYILVIGITILFSGVALIALTRKIL